ncbi:MAG: multidrug transporter [Sphingomonas sp. SCN 67-18]|uniref:SapC family protein n=1 Tax=uncultured Sphingomonas sp. TaxID=158754 RepID=UPI0008683285|nr:SapC family protein [Sphingomonas sp. SCN 67-18]ODU21284.1 MAG: multidrug transporter [Sphingomonas sp. SCN 67-18]
MASAPQTNDFPILYNDLVPLSSQQHGDWKGNRVETAPFLANYHAVPVTIDEFALAQRFFPIVFTSGDQPVPLALMGLNEGANTIVDDEGKLIREDTYVPAYIRRYPFMLAKLRPDTDELSLCFDPTSEALGPNGDGDPLFVDGKPSETTQAILGFCEQFEQAAQRTGQFMKELVDAKVLIDGEVAIQQEGNDQPFIYRGFQMVSEEKLRELRGDTLRKMAKNGMLPLIYAHMFSMQLMREVFARQMAMGKVPMPQPVQA